MHGDTVAYGAGDGTTGLWNPTANPDVIIGSFHVRSLLRLADTLRLTAFFVLARNPNTGNLFA
jgi:hypothetical protein